MNREIKFRVWDVKNKKMIYPEFLVQNNYGILVPAFLKDDYLHKYYIDEHVEYTNQDDLIIMQYTGFKDKNGKEIYDGDIVNYYLNNKKENFIGIVRWDNSGYWKITNDKDWIIAGCFGDLVNIEIKSVMNIEIIGNDFELL